MRSFSRIGAHQSTSETFNTSLWRRKSKPASDNYFAIVVLHFRDKFLSFLCCETSCFKNDFSSPRQREPVSYFNQYSRIFSSILPGQRAQRPISFIPFLKKGYFWRISSSDVPESFSSSQSHKSFESESSQIHKPFETESSQSHLKFFESSQSHDVVESSQNRVTKTVESPRVIDLQARVNVESHEISHFFYYIFYAMKWRLTCYKMAPDKLENGAQHAIKWRLIG